MPLSLEEKQFVFAERLSDLLAMAHALGFQVKLGETYRPPETAALYAAQKGRGIVHSLHCDRLAVDLCLFSKGAYLTDTESYRKLGEWWENQSCEDVTMVWGGRFGDGNHFSIGHGGRK